MKDLFLGLKIAKTRTILSALVTAIVTAGICITVSAFAPKGANQTSIIILCVSLAMIGCILLFLINRISSKKRDAEFLTMMYNGTSHKQIRKQLIKEVIAVALIFGLIGGAIGIGLSSPVSRILIPQKSENFSQMPNFNEGEAPSKDEVEGQWGATPNGEKPNIEEFNGERPDISEFNGERPSDLPSNAEKPSDFGEKKPNGNSGMRYVMPASAGGIAIALFTISSILGVALPVKKQED